MRILYIDIDSLRSDHLGCYGYHRDTSPAIDQLAREGLVCEKVYTSDAPCLPSRTALYSGRLGIQTGVVGHGGTAAQPKIEGPTRNFRDTFDEQGLAHQLQRLGLHTAMISPFGQRHAAHWFYAGFNEVHNTGKGGIESAEDVMPVVNPWLASRARQDNWYLHVNFWDPHTPYRVPASYGDPFKNDPLPAWLNDENLIKRHNAMTGPHTSLDLSMFGDQEDLKFPRQPGAVKDLAGMRRMIDGYDTGVRYADAAVGSIIASLKAAGVYEDTIIILSADHGENLGELGIYAEHGTADEGTCHIPMIIKFPGGVKGTRDTGLHYQLDLAPTLMELLGGRDQPLWDGESFASTVLTGVPHGRPEIVLVQCAHVCQRSVRWAEWLYIRTYHDGFHLFPEEMLFNLQVDPHEQEDLASKRSEICREGLFRLTRWHEAQMSKMTRTSSNSEDPLWTVMREGGPYHASLGAGNPGRAGLEKYLKRLEDTGRADGALALRNKYAFGLGKM